MSMKFRSQLQVDNIDDPFIANLWEVILPELDISMYVNSSISNNTAKYAPIVEEITFAPLGFENSTDIRAITTYYNIPLDKKDAKEANISLYCENDMKAQYYLKAWREMMFNEEHEFYYEPWQYKRDIIVNFYGLSSETPVIQYYLKGAYPILQDDITLKYSRTPNRFIITQKFNVDRVIIQNYNQNGRNGLLGTAVGLASTLAEAAGNIKKIGANTLTNAILSSKQKAIGVTPQQQDNAYGTDYPKIKNQK